MVRIPLKSPFLFFVGEVGGGLRSSISSSIKGLLCLLLLFSVVAVFQDLVNGSHLIGFLFEFAGK